MNGQGNTHFTPWAYLLILTPFLTDWLETGHLPSRPQEYLTELTVGLLIAITLTLIRRNMARLRELAETDALTGLYNRRKFIADLEDEAALARRLNSRLALAYVDVDAFKTINDTYGHAEGDAVLRAVAGLLRASARRRVDRCYRLGGDEFALLLIGIDAQTGLTFLEDALAENRTHYSVLQRYGVSLSLGTAEWRSADSVDSFLHRADTRMYRSKGQNQPLSSM